jgi:hypothetical protein
MRVSSAAGLTCAPADAKTRREMGKGDNRRTLKTRRRKRQRKLKARLLARKSPARKAAATAAKK